MSRANSWVPALLALLLGGAISLTPAPAYAQSADRRDPRGDVSRVDQGTMKGTSAPGRANGDVLRTVLRHKKHRIRIRVGFADLRRSFGALDITAFIDTSKGLHREAMISVDRNDLNDPWRGVSWLDNGEDQVRCAVHHSLDYQHNVAIIGFSRSCLNRPRWVRIGVNVRTWPPYPEDENAPFFGFEDNGMQRNGGDVPYPPPRSRRLFRG